VTGFIIRRLLSSLLVVVLTSLFVFVLFFKGLGDSPAVNYCEQLGPGKCTTTKLDAIKREMGFDQSVVTNYAEWAKGIFVGRQHVYVDGKYYDCPAPCLGISIMTGNTVWHDLKQKFPATVAVAVGGSAIYLSLGVVLGAFAARWRGSPMDRMLVGSTLIVSLKLGLFPNTGYYPITQDPVKTVTWMALPWLVIGLTNCTDYARFTRGQMVETLGEDYIRTAMAKGVVRRRVLFKHALRAAVVPVITIFGIDFATLLSGTIFTERIFGIDGIGNWGLTALSTPMDLNVVSTTVLVGAVMIVVANLLVDILYGFLDPRVTVA
jgi:peptide/nickel transport system permease protein